MITAHKSQPAYQQYGITVPWESMSQDMEKGLQLAAYICRMYGAGEIWAETILCHGEQVRGRWWMEYEKFVSDHEQGRPAVTAPP